MGDVDSAVTRRRFTLRQVIGWVAAVAAAAVLVAFVLGAWNPWGLTVLWRYAGNWLQGAVFFFAALLIALWLLAPVRDEARHTGRARWRIAVAVLLVFSLIAYGMFGAWLKPGYQIRAHSPDGERTIVMYGPDSDFQRLHVWAGTGLGQRDVGDLGKPCGPTKVWMDDRNTVHVTTSYLTRSLRLDPETGKPLDRLGPTCTQ
jgi:hypothetical protein